MREPREEISRVDAYLDGELEGPERAAFERELEASPELRRALRLRQDLDAAIRTLPEVEPSAQFEARFHARLARAGERRGLRALLGRGRGWALALSVAAAILLLVGNPSRREADWQILADPEAFDVVMEEDLEFLSALDVLERLSDTEVL